MSLSTPTSTDAHYDLNNNSTLNSSPSFSNHKDEQDPGEKRSSKMRKEGRATNRGSSSCAGSPSGESREEIWQQLEKFKNQARQRKQTDEAIRKSDAPVLISSEPLYRTPYSIGKDHQALPAISVERGFRTPAKRQGGVDPIFFESLGDSTSEKILLRQLAENTPKPLPIPGPRVNGQWTVLHCGAARNLALIPALIASGASLDAQDGRGYTLLHVACADKDTKAANQLLVAGANPLTANKNGVSPLFHALLRWPEMAQAMAEAVPAGEKANVEQSMGCTETHAAAFSPGILYILLSKGLRDQECNLGETALMLASSDGIPLSVKYLLGHRPADESVKKFSRYLESRSKETGHTALGEACVKNHLDIAELLIRHGASLGTLPGQPSLLRLAVKSGKTELMKLLLEHGAADLEPDRAGLLFHLVKRGASEGVTLLGKFVSLDKQHHYKLLREWVHSLDRATLTAISPLLPPTIPTVKALVGRKEFLDLPFTQDSTELLVAMLEFFDERDTFNFVIQSFVSHLLDDGGDPINADMGKSLLRFALPRLSRLRSDRETVMRLLQLSERLRDYSLVSEIKAKNFSDNRSDIEKIPFDPAWISDPVSLELLGVKDEQDAGKLSNLLQTVSAWIAPHDDDQGIDSAQLSNDLTLALKSDSVGKALAETFEAHRISAVIREALLPLLEKLVTGLYPDREFRPDSVSRLLIAYTLSNLAQNPLFTDHPSMALMKSDPQWASMKQKVDADIESIEQVAETILDTMVAEQLGPGLPEVAARLTLQTQQGEIPFIALQNAFRSALGLLDFPARRLAEACVQAARSMGTSPTNSTSSTTALPTGKAQTPLARFTSLIRQQLQAMEKQPMLHGQLTKDMQALDVRVIDSYHDIVWWQMDILFKAFGVDDSHGSKQQENEKS